MAEVSNDYESGTQAAALTTDVSAGAFDTISTTGTGTLAEFSNTNPQHGVLAARFYTNDGGGGGQSYGNYTTKIGTLSNHYGRVYGKFVTLPAAERRFLQLLDGGGWGDAASFYINAAGTLLVKDNGAVTLYTSSTGLLSAVNWRIEYYIDQRNAGATDTLQVKVFVGGNKDGTTADADTGILTTTFGNNTTEIIVGWANASFDTPRNLHVDDIVFGATAWVGPVIGGGNLSVSSIGEPVIGGSTF